MMVVMIMANALARLARAVLGAGAGRMRNRIASRMSLARATCPFYIKVSLHIWVPLYI